MNIKNMMAMGELAEDIEDGVCCQLCGTYFDEEEGFPTICDNCLENRDDDET